MPINLTLRPRGKNSDGDPTWHDREAVEWAIRNIAKGKSITDLQLWIAIPAKIEKAAQEIGYGKKTKEIPIGRDRDGKEIKGWLINLPEFTISLSNTQQRNFWKELIALPMEKFAASDKVENPGFIILMLEDMAAQFSEKVPWETDEEEK
jgi:hypothetical protein